MTDPQMVPLEHSELRHIIHQARWRWRAKLLARAALIVGGGGLLVLLVSAYGVQSLRFSPAAIIGFRVVLALAVAAMAGLFLVRPMLRRPTDEQVALYLEEHHPSLDAAVVSAVDVSTAGPAASRNLVRQLVNDAIERCGTLDAARSSDRQPLRAYGIALLAVAVVAAVSLLLAPGEWRSAIAALLRFSQDVEAASPYRIAVEPGTAKVPRGSDQQVVARLSGFTADSAVLMSRKGQDGAFERAPMLRREDGSFDLPLFNLSSGMEYFVEASGVRSSRYQLTLVDLPYVKRLDLEYVYPMHAGLEPEKVENGGNVAALMGSTVRVRAFATMKAAGGRILLDDKRVLPLQVEPDGTLTGQFPVDHNGFYRIELDTAAGEHVAASPQYTIDALSDRGPTVRFTKPQRDVSASALEEVFVEAQADDDYGIRDLRLVYSVNGGPEKSVRLYGGLAKPLKEVTAGYTFYMEELGVQAGDFVSYHAKAGDNDAVAGSKAASSDLYFVRVRPFDKSFRQAQSQGGGGGGGDTPGSLSEDQRHIISATFNLLRDRPTMTPDRVREASVVIALSQAKLRERVAELASRMQERIVEAEPGFKGISDLLPKAAEEMKAAETQLEARKHEAALPPEQRALSLLQKAEEQYEVQVAMTRGGGGGGGGNDALSEDLARLFEMEIDKRANQYETVQGAESQSSASKLDELAEKLRELARRQEQEAERQRRAADLGGQGGANGQRNLADQAEDAARQLEKLAREESRPELMDAARRLQQAADAMRRAAASGTSGGAGQAGSALEGLRDAQERLSRDRESQAQGNVADALREAEEIAQRQREIANESAGVAGRLGSERQERLERLNDQKDDLASRVEELERRLDANASGIRRDQKDAAQKLREAAGSLRENRVRDKIRFSKEVLRRGTPEQAQAFENDIGANLDDVRDKLQQAAGSVSRAAADPRNESLERARQLARGLESLDRRARDNEGGGQEGRDREAKQGGQPNQQGKPGQQGQPGQNGQPGQQPGQSSQSNGQPGDSREQGDSSGQNASASSSQGEASSQGGDPSQPGQASSPAAGRGGAQGGRGPVGPFGGPSFSPQDMRQFRGEVRRWTAEAQELERQLRSQGVETADLNEVVRNLRMLDDDRVFADPSGFARLQGAVVEGARRVEFRLRRQAGEDAAPSALADDEIPEGFRPMVEEYYRALSKGGKR